MQKTKLARIGNSTGVTFQKDVLLAAGLDRGDVESIAAHTKALEAGRRFAQLYRRTMADLAQ